MVEAKPDYQAAQLELGRALLQIGDREQALAGYQKLIEANRLKRRGSLEATHPQPSRHPL